MTAATSRADQPAINGTATVVVAEINTGTDQTMEKLEGETTELNIAAGVTADSAQDDAKEGEPDAHKDEVGGGNEDKEADILSGNAGANSTANSGNAAGSTEFLGISGLDFDPKTEAQTYDALRWIPIFGDAYSLGRAAYFALGGNTTEAGLCATNVIPFVGNVITTAKRVKDAKDASGGNSVNDFSVDSASDLTSTGATEPAAPPAPLPPVYTKIISLFDEFFGSPEPGSEQNQGAQQQQEEGESQESQADVQRNGHEQSRRTSAGNGEVRNRRSSERRASNNFGDEDPVLAMKQHAHEALADIRSDVDIPAGPLEDTEALRKSSAGDIKTTNSSTKERSGFSATYVSGAGLVPVMRT